MAQVKDVMTFVVKPLNYIFNLSLQTGVFPNNMIIAKVIPIYKNCDIHSLIIDQSVSFHYFQKY